MHIEKYISSFKGLFLQIFLCFNFFVIGPSCGCGTSNISVRYVILMLGGGVSELYHATINFLQEPGFLYCIAGSIWSSNIFSYQALFGFWQKMSIALSDPDTHPFFNTRRWLAMNFLDFVGSWSFDCCDCGTVHCGESSSQPDWRFSLKLPFFF